MNAFGHDSVVPFKDSSLSKKEQVGLMFDRIAFRYDFLNHLLSGGQDSYWRKRAIRELKEINPQSILDVATGTGDLLILLSRLLRPREIIGVDISEGMLQIARKKLKKAGRGTTVRVEPGDAEHLDFPDSRFDAITVAFGVRNFEHLAEGLREMLRVLRPGGKILILEFSQPRNNRFRRFCSFYLGRIAPILVQLFSKKQAYQYLGKSIQAFPEGEEFLAILEKAGYRDSYAIPLSFGICTVYCGYK